jgi:hypothetical protein
VLVAHLGNEHKHREIVVLAKLLFGQGHDLARAGGVKPGVRLALDYLTGLAGRKSRVMPCRVCGNGHSRCTGDPRKVPGIAIASQNTALIRYVIAHLRSDNDIADLWRALAESESL